MNNICTGLIIISIILFVLVYIFFPETFGNSYLESSSNKKYHDNFSQSQYEGIGPVREELDSKKLEKNPSKSENENSSPEYQELVNEAKKIKQKLDSENPDINKVLRLSNFAGIDKGNGSNNINESNKYCISNAPEWWYPIDKYDPDKFKEKVDYKNFIPAFDYLGNTQEVYWDFKQQMINN